MLQCTKQGRDTAMSMDTFSFLYLAQDSLLCALWEVQVGPNGFGLSCPVLKLWATGIFGQLLFVFSKVPQAQTGI